MKKSIETYDCLDDFELELRLILGQIFDRFGNRFSIDLRVDFQSILESIFETFYFSKTSVLLQRQCDRRNPPLHGDGGTCPGI